jgi:hypothetical protein
METSRKREISTKTKLKLLHLFREITREVTTNNQQLIKVARLNPPFFIREKALQYSVTMIQNSSTLFLTTLADNRFLDIIRVKLRNQMRRPCHLSGQALQRCSLSSHKLALRKSLKLVNM